MLPNPIRNRQVLLAYAATYVCTDLLCPTQRTYSFPRRKRVSRKVRLGVAPLKTPMAIDAGYTYPHATLPAAAIGAQTVGNRAALLNASIPV